MAKLLDGIPVLQGEMVGSQVRVWCVFCRKYHYHGWPYPDEKIIHRVAHCINNDSPYHDTDYYIEVNEDG